MSRFRQVSRGQRLTLPASWYNETLEVADRVLRPGGSDVPPASTKLPVAMVVKGMNTGNADIGSNEPVYLFGCDFKGAGSTNNSVGIHESWRFTVKSTAETLVAVEPLVQKNFGVSIDSIVKNQVGRIVIWGAAVCWIRSEADTVGEIDTEYVAVPVTGQRYLKSQRGDGCRLVVKPSTPKFNSWGVVIVGDWLQLHRNCKFKLSSALSTSNNQGTGTIQTQWGGDIDHDDSQGHSITVLNYESVSGAGAYKWEGDSGDYGMATWDPILKNWNIIDMECP